MKTDLVEFKKRSNFKQSSPQNITANFQKLDTHTY